MRVTKVPLSGGRRYGVRMVPFFNAPYTGHNTRMLQMRAHKIRFFFRRSFDKFYLDG